jgi:hypothetical protein
VARRRALDDPGNYLDELKTRAKSFASLVSGQDASGLDIGPIDLGGSGDLTRGYLPVRRHVRIC